MLSPQNGRMRLLAIPAAGLALLLFGASVQAASEDLTATGVPPADHTLESHAQAKVLLNRLSDTAMDACGASSHAAAQAVRGSACWRTSMTAVVQRIGNPSLTAAFEGR